MKKKLFGISTLFIFLTSTTFAFFPGNFAENFNSENSEQQNFGQKNFGQKMRKRGKNFRQKKFENLSDEQKAEIEAKMAERKAAHEKIKTAIENGDYETWKNLQLEKKSEEISKIEEKFAKKLATITAENFAQFAEMHAALRSGDKNLADEIRDELGLPEKKFGHPRGKRSGQKFGRQNRGNSKNNFRKKMPNFENNFENEIPNFE